MSGIAVVIGVRDEMAGMSCSTRRHRKQKFASRWNCSSKFSGKNVTILYFDVLMKLFCNKSERKPCYNFYNVISRLLRKKTLNLSCICSVKVCVFILSTFKIFRYYTKRGRILRRNEYILIQKHVGRQVIFLLVYQLGPIFLRIQEIPILFTLLVQISSIFKSILNTNNYFFLLHPIKNFKQKTAKKYTQIIYSFVEIFKEHTMPLQ